jgi:protein-S-isoprenylcysteine O-methyltransferase Ste14
MRGLILRSVAGLVFLVAMLGLALFGAAGTLSYWRAWLYLAVFAGCIVLITLYLFVRDRRLLESRLNVGPAAEQQRSQQLIQGLASIFFLLVYVVAGLDHRFGWSHVPPALSVLADLFVALGLLIVFLVFRENTYTSAIIELADQQRVVSTGPYRVVRHPMYSGALLMLLFTPLALGSWVALPLVLPLILVIAARLLAEEKFLAKGLAGYDDYRRAVRYRLIPWIW